MVDHPENINVFILFAEEDLALKQELETHLRDRVLISVRFRRSYFGFRQAQKIGNSGSIRYFLCEV
jgi:hypothetical protein